ATSAHAQVNLIQNGGFESGSLTGWIVATPSIGAAYADGLTPTAGFYVDNNADNDPSTPGTQYQAPISRLSTLGPKTGNYYALSDMNAQSNVALLQSFVAPATGVVNISFDMYVYDWSGSAAYDSAAGLNYNTPNPNQAARVDLLFSSAVGSGGAGYYVTG